MARFKKNGRPGHVHAQKWFCSSPEVIPPENTQKKSKKPIPWKWTFLLKINGCFRCISYWNSPFLGVIQVLELVICPDLIRNKNAVEKAKVKKKTSLEDIQFQFRLGDERGRWSNFDYHMFQMWLVQPQKQVLISFLFLWIKNNQQYQHHFSASGAFQWQFFGPPPWCGGGRWGSQMKVVNHHPGSRVPSLATKKHVLLGCVRNLVDDS